MSRTRIIVVAAFMLLAFTAAFAASNSTQINLTSAATVAGTKLQPGTYKVTWTGQGDNLNVTLKSGKTEVTAHATTAKNDSPMSSTSFVTNKDGELTEIRPAGKGPAIKFTGGQNASMNTNSSTSNP